MVDVVSFDRQQTSSSAPSTSSEPTLDDELADFHKLLSLAVAFQEKPKSSDQWSTAGRSTRTRKRDNRQGRRQSRRERRRLRVLQSILPPSQQIPPTLHPILEVADETKDERRLFLFRSSSNPEIMVPRLQHEQGLTRILSLDEQERPVGQKQRTMLGSGPNSRAVVHPQMNEDEDSILNLSTSASIIPLTDQAQAEAGLLRQISELSIPPFVKVAKREHVPQLLGEVESKPMDMDVGALTDGAVLTTLSSSHTTTACGSVFMDFVEAVGQELGIIPSISGDNMNDDEKTIVTMDNDESSKGLASLWISSPNHLRNSEEKEMEQEDRSAKIQEGSHVGIVEDLLDQIMAVLSTSVCGETSLRDLATTAKREFGIVDDEQSDVFKMSLTPSCRRDDDEMKTEEKEMEQDKSSTSEDESSRNEEVFNENESFNNNKKVDGKDSSNKEEEMLTNNEEDASMDNSDDELHYVVSLGSF